MRPAFPWFARIALFGLAAGGAGSCGQKPDTTFALPAERGTGTARRDEPPVALNPESPVGYPPAVFQQRISGTVLLQLFVDQAGRLVPESSRVQESSGYPALDSAALAAAPKLRYAPALRNGAPVATFFTQPVHFRHPDRGGTTP
jgi:protein TonB